MPATSPVPPAPAGFPGVRRHASRHRASEPFSPRPSECIAARFAALATLAQALGVHADVEGARLDGPALRGLAGEEAAKEGELAALWLAFHEAYVRHSERVGARLRLLLRAVEAIERDHGARLDAPARALLRAAKRRRKRSAGRTEPLERRVDA